MNKIITVGREFGSGGREFARKLAKELGYEYYDKEIVAEIAKHTTLSEKYVEEVIEKNPHDLLPITVGHSFAYVDTFAIERRQMIFAEQEKVVREMAEKSNCVIVGRCADYILEDLNPFKIFVYAGMEFKTKRCKAHGFEENMSDKKIRKYIKRLDKNRAKYYEFYTGQLWGDRLNYDLCINTTNQDIDSLVKSIANLLR